MDTPPNRTEQNTDKMTPSNMPIAYRLATCCDCKQDFYTKRDGDIYYCPNCLSTIMKFLKETTL